MQDRFKFRAYYKVDKKMHNVNAVIAQENCIELFEVGEEPSPEDFKGIITARKEMCVLMQCTGLKDKSGKLIYEGDIVNVFFDIIKPHYMPFVVIWDRKEWQLAQLNKNYKKCENCNRNYTKCKYCKKFFMATGHTNFKDFYNGFVIGNIYENPELLESEVK